MILTDLRELGEIELWNWRQRLHVALERIVTEKAATGRRPYKPSLAADYGVARKERRSVFAERAYHILVAFFFIHETLRFCVHLIYYNPL